MAEEKKFLNLDHARTEEQKVLMSKIIDDGVCPFCWEYFETYHPKPVIAKSDYWIMTENMSPYEGTRLHYLFVYKKHITNPVDMEGGAYDDLLKLVQKAVKENDIVGGTLLMRFGDTNYTGGSVNHLHAQLVIGGPRKEGAEKINQKIGYKI